MVVTLALDLFDKFKFTSNGKTQILALSGLYSNFLLTFPCLFLKGNLQYLDASGTQEI